MERGKANNSFQTDKLLNADMLSAIEEDGSLLLSQKSKAPNTYTSLLGYCSCNSQIKEYANTIRLKCLDYRGMQHIQLAKIKQLEKEVVNLKDALAVEDKSKVKYMKISSGFEIEIARLAAIN